MDASVLLSTGVAVVVLAALYLAWRIWRTGERPESLGEWAVQAEAAARWGQMAVAAAQQLFESDQIDADARFEHADRFLADTLPNLTPDQRRMIIEASVLGLNELRARGWIPASGALPESRP